VSQRTFIQDFLFVLGPARRRLPFIALLILLSTMLDLLSLGLVVPLISALSDSSYSSPGFLGRWIHVPAGKPQTLFLVLGLAVVLAFTIKGVAGYWVQRVIVGFSQLERSSLMIKLMRTYMYRPYEFHLSHNSASLINTVTTLTGQYSANVLGASARILADGTMLVAIMVFLAFTNWVAVLIMGLTLGMVFLIYSRVVRKRIEQLGKQYLQSTGGIIQAVNQGLGAFKESKVLGVEQNFIAAMARDAEICASTSAQAQSLAVVPRFIIENALIIFLVLFSGVELLIGKNPNSLIPTLGVFAAAGLRLMPGVNSVVSSAQALRSSRYLLTELATALREAGTPTAPPTQLRAAPTPPPDFQELKLDRVGYTYPTGSRAAVDEVSLAIAAGQAVGIIGRSGAGKSTLADIVLGLLAPQSGQVLVNGKPLSSDRSEWYRMVAYIPQSIFLIDDTLRRNVAFGVEDADIDEQRLQNALEVSQLRPVVAELPQGVDTVLGERGVRLSGGQKQRVAIARALYHDRQFIVMDEATASLDNETEREVVSAIRNLHGIKTLFIIAHRLSTLEGCDFIVRLADGRLVQTDSYERIEEAEAKAKT
jgi:ATP-binding cassette, subfamily B, bacterial PglK